LPVTLPGRATPTFRMAPELGHAIKTAGADTLRRRFPRRPPTGHPCPALSPDGNRLPAAFRARGDRSRHRHRRGHRPVRTDR
jgi:hypothetical protein